MAKVVYTSGKSVEVSPANGTDFSLDELHAVVGGYIEFLDLYDDGLMVVNEEGKLMGLPVNGAATEYLLENSRHRDIIVGNVLICDRGQVK